MESWRLVFRKGIAPHLSTAGLLALEFALKHDLPSLIQGMTTEPPPLAVAADLPCKCACVIGYTGWQGNGLKTVDEVESYFARVCSLCDQELNESAACHWFISWADSTPRDEMRAALLLEVRAVLAEREALEVH